MIFPGGVRQFGFFVADLDAAIARWADLGVAPWFVMREVAMTGCHYRGQLSEPVISIALANNGDMQVELVQQHDDTPSIYKEFMDATGGGFNQVAYWVKDIDTVLGAALAAGWTEVWCGAAGARFSYLEHPDSPVPIVELVEDNDISRPMNAAVRAAADAWRPGEPVIQVVDLD